MAVSNLAIFPQLPFSASAVATAANTTLSDATDANIVELVLPTDVESDGCQIVAAVALPRATCTATVLYLYLSTDNGTTRRLVAVASAVADTVSATDAPAEVAFKFKGSTISESNPLYIPPGSGSAKARLYFGASVALSAGWVAHVQGLRLTKAA